MRIWSHGGKPNREGVEGQGGGGEAEMGRDTEGDRQGVVHTFGICDKSSRVALSVLSCVFARGECGPARLRRGRSVQLQGRRGRQVSGPRGSPGLPRGRGWTRARAGSGLF